MPPHIVPSSCFRSASPPPPPWCFYLWSFFSCSRSLQSGSGSELSRSHVRRFCPPGSWNLQLVCTITYIYVNLSFKLSLTINTVFSDLKTTFEEAPQSFACLMVWGWNNCNLSRCIKGVWDPGSILHLNNTMQQVHLSRCLPPPPSEASSSHILLFFWQKRREHLCLNTTACAASWIIRKTVIK